MIVIMTRFIAVMIIMIIADIMIIVAVVVIGFHVGLHIAPHRYVVTVSVIAIVHVANGMVAPIRVAFLPAVKAFQPHRIARDPDVTGSQIEIIRADDAYIFIAVPYVGIGHANFHGHCRCRYDHDRRRGWHDYGRCHDYGGRDINRRPGQRGHR